MKKKLELKYIIFITTMLLSVVTLLSFWFICNRKVSELITDRAVDDYAEITMSVQKNLETLVSYGENFAKYLSLDEQVCTLLEDYNAASPEEQAMNTATMHKKWEDISIQILYSTTRLAGFGVYSGQELLYSFFNSAGEYDTDIIPSVSLEAAAEQKQPLWTDLLTLNSATSWFNKEAYVFSILKYVQGDNGEYLGTIVLFVRESGFSDVFANADDTKNKQFYLIDEKGKIISSEDKTYLYQNIREVLNITESQYETCLSEKQMLLEPEGEAPILYMSSIIEGTNFRLIGRTVLEELEMQRRDLNMYMKMILVLILGLAVVSSWLISRQVTKPLNRIIGVMRKIEDGPNKERIRCPVEGTEEIRLLGQEFNRLMDKLDESADQIYMEQRQRRHNEVRLLQAQIIPHFLYNTMGMISALIKLGRLEAAQDAIQNLANFYRLSLSVGNEKVTIGEEIELTRNYMALQKMRYIEYVEYRIEHDENTAQCQIPKLTIQPLVENVLHHGLNPTGEKCTIIIKTQYDKMQNRYIISVLDNGRGITKERLAQIQESLRNEHSLTQSFGLLNVYQRMKLMYGNRFRMTIDSIEGEFTKFTLYLREETDTQEVR